MRASPAIACARSPAGMGFSPQTTVLATRSQPGYHLNLMPLVTISWTNLAAIPHGWVHAGTEEAFAPETA